MKNEKEYQIMAIIYTTKKNIQYRKVEDYTESEKKMILEEIEKYPAIKVTLDFSYPIPEYNDRDFAVMANQAINRKVILPTSRQYQVENECYIHTVTLIPRSSQQMIGGGSVTSWENQVRIYNFFAEQLGFQKIKKT